MIWADAVVQHEGLTIFLGAVGKCHCRTSLMHNGSVKGD